MLSSGGMIHFVFPQNPLEPRQVDDHFAGQRAALEGAGFSTSIVHDAVFDSGANLHGVPRGAVVVYRGWMVNADQYRNFVTAVEGSGAVPFTSHDAYLHAHYLPNWYYHLSDLTPETVVLSEDVNLESALRQLGWPAFFIKDYVKSLKTKSGSLITDPAEAERVVSEMKKFRGMIEGGICVRRVEQFKPDTEVRYFVRQGRPFSAAVAGDIPDIVRSVASRIDSPFFSVDVVLSESSELRVVEVGDGQVSDLVGWTLPDFLRMWHATA